MALTCNQILCKSPTRTSYTHLSLHRPSLFPSNPSGALPLNGRTSLLASAAKKLSPRTGKFESKKRRSSLSTKEQQEEERTAEIERTRDGGSPQDSGATATADVSTGAVDDGYFLPELPGDKPDFWEGPQWDGLGFFVQYMWAFGIVFALIACGIAVVTYNEGATDFKKTPAYKESIQSRELLEEPEASNSDVFESNPTEQAPSLE